MEGYNARERDKEISFSSSFLSKRKKIVGRIQRSAFPLPSLSFQKEKKLLERYNATERERERERNEEINFSSSFSFKKKTIGRIQRHREREREREIKRLTFLVLPSRSKRKKTVGRIQRHRKRERERLAEGILLAPVHARVYNRWG